MEAELEMEKIETKTRTDQFCCFTCSKKLDVYIVSTVSNDGKDCAIDCACRFTLYCSDCAGLVGINKDV